MIEPRLATNLIVSALRRKVESVGGFATILHKGDPVAGALLLVIPQQDNKSDFAGFGPDSGAPPLILEQEPAFDGPRKWQPVTGQITENVEKTEEYLARRKKSDPDLWIIELDVADAERFAAEINGSA